MDERRRVTNTFSRYARSRRKQRAWKADRPGNRAIREELCRCILEFAGRDLRAGQVLDMGCGTGWWLERLSGIVPEPARLHGVDLLEARVQAAAKRVPAADVRIADVRQLPYADDRFSVVSLLLVLSSLGDRAATRETLRQAHRVLAPGGVVVVWEPHWPNPLNPTSRRVPARLVAEELGAPVERAAITVLPPLARILPDWRTYDRLASLPPLRTHRLTIHRPKP